MGQREKIIGLILEFLGLAGACGSIGLELYYMTVAGAGIFDTVLTCFFVACIYLLFTVMQHYPKLWNILIPATEKNEHYAVYMALGLKVLLMCMTLYTAVCDVGNIYSNAAVFWLVVAAGILILCIMKYKMWKINEKDKKDQKKNDRG